MRLLHLTDAHFYRAPPVRGIAGKRALGLLNLHLLRRVRRFDADRLVPSAVQDAMQFRPDVFVMTGDLTALAGEEEFAAARRALDPLLATVPSVVLPGNHDRYARDAAREGRLERWFGDFARGGTWDDGARRWVRDDEAGRAGWPVRFRLGGTDLVATDPCRPTLRSTGRFGARGISEAEALVARGRLVGQQVAYLLHYPPLDERGRPYLRPSHRLVDVADLLGSLVREPPDLVLHGHVHRWWCTALAAGGRRVPVLCGGSASGCSPDADRAAGYFVIDLDGGLVTAIRRRALMEGAGTWQDLPVPSAGS